MQDAGADPEKFLEYYGVKALDDIAMADYRAPSDR